MGIHAGQCLGNYEVVFEAVLDTYMGVKHLDTEERDPALGVGASAHSILMLITGKDGHSVPVGIKGVAPGNASTPIFPSSAPPPPLHNGLRAYAACRSCASARAAGTPQA